MDRYVFELRFDKTGPVKLSDVLLHTTIGMPREEDLSNLHLTGRDQIAVPFGFGNIRLTHSTYKEPDDSTSAL